MRAMSLRTSRTRSVFSIWPVARWKRRLNCSFFSLSELVVELVGGHAPRTSSIFISVLLVSHASQMPGDDAGLDRQLGRAEAQRFAGDVVRHAVDLEHDPARLDARGPVLDRALALAHAHFGRLVR